MVELYRRHWDRGSWSDYGVVWDGPFWQVAGWGFAIAILGVALLIGGQWALGWRRRTLAAERASALVDWRTLLALLPITVLIGWVEELVFRGVLVNGLLAILPWGAMALVASLIFAVSHLVWDGQAGVPSYPV
ncbi:MAG: CPBP family intramembrane metalloprotease [Leptolyngbyaceae cyanobacterium SM2_5_2]|nr:CPBP family intramembrane metalloprotease [Leptolyngbyaceae cyanobacterium SM2_5_2]